MKRILFLVLMSIQVNAFASIYPATFSWKKYVTPVIDQVRQGPCGVFAAVGGMESVYNLTYSPVQTPDFSERFGWSATNGGGLGDTLNFAHNEGIVTAICEPYPTTDAPNENISDLSELTANHQLRIPHVVLKDYTSVGGFRQFQLSCFDKKRFKPNYEDVSYQIRTGDDERVKYLLVNKGPLSVHMYEQSMHGTDHAYVLYGWESDSSGRPIWLYRDSWPQHSTNRLTSLVSPAQIFRSDTSATAFVINRVTEENYTSGAWTDVSPTTKPFELEQQNQIVTINKPVSCDNTGTYTLSNLDKIDGATMSASDWSIRSSYAGSLQLATNSVANGPPIATLTGSGSGVTLVATIRRPNGWIENATKNIGDVGNVMPPVTYVKTRECSGWPKKITIQVTSPTNGTPSVPASGYNYNAFVSGSFVIVSFQGPGSAPVTYTIPGVGGCAAKSGLIANAYNDCPN
jgi:Papain family cysteine protease